jgi:hypothetical protein
MLIIPLIFRKLRDGAQEFTFQAEVNRLMVRFAPFLSASDDK